MLPLREIVSDQSGYYKNVCIVVCSICVFYIIYAEFTNLAWGEAMDGNALITSLLPPTSVVAYACKIAYTVNLFCTYPL